MANSSDWLGRFAGDVLVDDADDAPAWLTLVGSDGGFREVSPFAAPADDISAPPPSPEVPAPDPLADAIARAFAEGERAGRAAAEAEAEERAARQRAVRLSFRALDEAASAVLAEDLATTVMTLCEGVLGEAARERDGLLARCDAAARRIGGAADALALHLHPEDIAVLGQEALASWRVVPDAALEPGSVVIAGPEGSAADGPAEWRRAIAAAVRG